MRTGAEREASPRASPLSYDSRKRPRRRPLAHVQKLHRAVFVGPVVGIEERRLLGETVGRHLRLGRCRGTDAP